MKKDILDQEVKYLKSVGPRRSALLAKLGIHSVRDLLTFFPREWEDRRQWKKIGELTGQRKAVVCGKIELSGVVSMGRKLSLFKAVVSDSTGLIYAVEYRRRSYRYDVFKKLKEDFRTGRKVIIYGKVEISHGNKQISIEEYEILLEKSTSCHPDFTGIIPLYSLTEGINARFMRQLVRQGIEKYVSYFPEIMPKQDKMRYNLIPVNEAIRQIHFPSKYELKNEARKRLVFDEFFLLELALAISRKQIEERKKLYHYKIKKHLLTPFKHNLGFEFTQSQKKVINEIFNNLESSKPMNRLLLGDVGSGKTVVALSAVLLAIENGYQTVLMVPTEILAEQHYYTVKRFLNNLDVKIELLIGQTSKAKKLSIKEKLIHGEIDLLIGTHALIEKDIKFKNLALIIIDEQHKFGVAQRQLLRQKSSGTLTGIPQRRASETGKSDSDILIMTATPIPRTLALTIYGDLDMSVIDELPPGRSPILTQTSTESQSYEFIRKEIAKGHQAYIVFPLVEESDKVELKSAVKEAKKLAEKVFPEFKVGLLHGQLPSKQKEKIMLGFFNKKYDLLTATTVIEVGIDVPNATVMVIEHAERFGLATLHQLRGRVGRSPQVQSYCFLLGEPKTDIAKKRIEVMVSTTDGFEIGEQDLVLRGPGEFFGTAQHGLSELKLGNIFRDIEIIKRARKYAQEVIVSDRFLSSPEHRIMHKELILKYGGKFILSQVG